MAARGSLIAEHRTLEQMFRKPTPVSKYTEGYLDARFADLEKELTDASKRLNQLERDAKDTDLEFEDQNGHDRYVPVATIVKKILAHMGLKLYFDYGRSPGVEFRRTKSEPVPK